MILNYRYIYHSWILILSQMWFLHNFQDGFSGTLCCSSVGGIKPSENGTGDAVSAPWGFDGIINTTCEVDQNAICNSTKKSLPVHKMASLSESTLSSLNLVFRLTWWGFSGIVEIRLDLGKTRSDSFWLFLWPCKWTDLTYGWWCTARWKPRCYRKFIAPLSNPVLYSDGNNIPKSWFAGHDSII